MDQFARLDIKMAYSGAWQGQVDAYLEIACVLESQKSPNQAKRNFRKALAIERLHRIAVKNHLPFWSWNDDEWHERKE